MVDYIKNTEGFKGKVYVSDCDKTASGLYGDNDGHFILHKPVDDEVRYVSELKELCKEKGIDVIIPVIDPEIDILSRYRDMFYANNISVIVSSQEVLEICYNKIKMNAFLDRVGLCYPLTYTSINDFMKGKENGEIDFPVIIKPVMGSGSVDTYVIHDYDRLCALFQKDMMIQQYLKCAEEYGTDTLNDLNGKTVRIAIKKKLSMRSGETDKSITVYRPQIKEILLSVGEKLGHIGNLDTDIMYYEGKYYIIDMNPRFGGGYPATHAAGINMLGLILEMVSGKEIYPEFDDYTENMLVMKTISINTTVLPEEL